MAYEEQHQIVAEEEARQKELMEKRKAELSQLLEEVEKTEQTRSRKPSIHNQVGGGGNAHLSGRSSQQSIGHSPSASRNGRLPLTNQRQRSSAESKSSNQEQQTTTIGSTLIDDDQAILHSPKTNGSARGNKSETPSKQPRRPSIANRALGAVKRSFLKSGE